MLVCSAFYRRRCALCNFTRSCPLQLFFIFGSDSVLHSFLHGIQSVKCLQCAVDHRLLQQPGKKESLEIYLRSTWPYISFFQPLRTPHLQPSTVFPVLSCLMHSSLSGFFICMRTSKPQESLCSALVRCKTVPQYCIQCLLSDARCQRLSARPTTNALDDFVSLKRDRRTGNYGKQSHLKAVRQSFVIERRRQTACSELLFKLGLYYRSIFIQYFFFHLPGPTIRYC